MSHGAVQAPVCRKIHVLYGERGNVSFHHQTKAGMLGERSKGFADIDTGVETSYACNESYGEGSTRNVLTIAANRGSFLDKLISYSIGTVIAEAKFDGLVFLKRKMIESPDPKVRNAFHAAAVTEFGTEQPNSRLGLNTDGVVHKPVFYIDEQIGEDGLEAHTWRDEFCLPVCGLIVAIITEITRGSNAKSVKRRGVRNGRKLGF